MKAISLNHVCNRCDDSVYNSTDDRVGDINALLENFDTHSSSYLTVQGNRTNRYVRLSLKGETDETIAAVQSVFMSAGYMTIVEQTKDDCTIHVIFDADIAPGIEEEGQEEEGAPEVMEDPAQQEEVSAASAAEELDAAGAEAPAPIEDEDADENPSGTYEYPGFGSTVV